MRFNYKRAILVGLVFGAINGFWQLYDSLVPIMLRDTFLLGDTVSGFVMSLDNILALILLPVFGAWSDRRGSRMPFILVGTAGAVVMSVLLPLTERAGSLFGFFVVLGLLLLFMGFYRSPAVALMPDVTPKPLRSKGNAMVNLMGAIGGAYALLMIQLLVKTPETGTPDYLPVFLSVAAVMAGAAIVTRLTINEKRLRAEARAIDGPEKIRAAEGPSKAALDPAVKRSLFLILASVAFWYMGYNAVTTAFTRYATYVWGQDLGQASTCLMVAMVGAVVSYVPIGILASRIGRKKTILIGVAVLGGSFAVCGMAASSFSPFLYVLFAAVGFAWAAINVNSYPMVAEISRARDMGKYTGYYYTFSMAAQVATPILSGALLEHVGYHTLFPYAAITVGLSFVTMLLTRHGDNRPARKASRLEDFNA